MEILDKLAQETFALKASPEKYEIESVASELVRKHPCLKEPNCGTGYDGWTTSIRYKLGNYRSKLRQAGCNEVAVNRKRGRDENGDGGRFSLKKPKRGEEKEIVEVEPMVLEVQERWPALFLEEQICEEFCRVTTKDLLWTFRAAVDKYSPRLLRLYRARKGYFSQDMDSLLEKLDEQVTHPEDEQTRGVQMGVLTVVEDDDDAPALLPSVTNIAIVLEDAIVLTDIPDLPAAFAFSPALFLEHGVSKGT
ncbi:hypothetical protein SRHO_G00140560 [Serrasalmus rhombeus]